MTAAEIVAIIQLVSVLEPQVVALITSLINTVNDSGATVEERQKTLDALAAALKPMTLK